MSDPKLKLRIDEPWSEDLDCYAIVRAFYADNYDLEMTDYARPADWWAKNPELDLLRSNFQAEGFEPIPNFNRRSLALGDGLLMNIGSRTISHCAVFLGNNWFYHMPFREKARKDLWAGYWADRTLLAIRHPKVYRPQVKPDVDLITLLSQDKQEKIRAALSQAGS